MHPESLPTSFRSPAQRILMASLGRYIWVILGIDNFSCQFQQIDSFVMGFNPYIWSLLMHWGTKGKDLLQTWLGTLWVLAKHPRRSPQDLQCPARVPVLTYSVLELFQLPLFHLLHHPLTKGFMQ